MTKRRRRGALEDALAASSADLLSYLRRRVDVDEAPDLLGETFVVAWRRLDDLPEDSERARMWLFGIARGVLRNHHRGVHRRWALADRIRGHAALTEPSPPADHHLEVRDAISRLDSDLSEIIRLVHWDGFTLAAAAAIIDIPASTARSRYQRAKDQLRATLDVPLATPVDSESWSGR